jgi:peroxiredoxin
MIGKKIPVVTFKLRVRDDSISGPNPFRWENKSSTEIFQNKNVLIFSLPGAFTPTCSTYQLREFEDCYEKFKANGVDEIYCVSVNDAFVMNSWGKAQNLIHVKLIPDGNGEFTRQMGMLVDKKNLGFGQRSWRYAALVKNGIVTQWFEEPGLEDDHGEDPYGVSSPSHILKELENAS